MAKITERHKVVRDLLKVMTKEELATKLEVSVFTIIRWQKAERNPNYAAFYLLKKIHKQRIK